MGRNIIEKVSNDRLYLPMYIGISVLLLLIRNKLWFKQTPVLVQQ